MLTSYIQSAERMVACPNQDVAHGVGSLDPQTSPVVIQVPDFGDRFWVYELCDQRTEKFAELGAMYGSAPGHYLVVTEDWEGEVPEGIADTDDDREAVQEVLNRIDVYPLDGFDGTEKTHDWKTVPDAHPKTSIGRTTSPFVLTPWIVAHPVAVLT